MARTTRLKGRSHPPKSVPRTMQNRVKKLQVRWQEVAHMHLFEIVVKNWGTISYENMTKMIYGFFFPPAPATVVVWDSQVKDGYKRSKAPAADDKSDDSSKCAASLSWDGKKTSGVVEELLKNASDKAYGANGKTFLFVCFLIFSKNYYY